MPDITKCNNNNCPLKSTCYRFMCKLSEFMQSYSDFEYKDGKCDYYWRG